MASRKLAQSHYGTSQTTIFPSVRESPYFRTSPFSLDPPLVDALRLQSTSGYRSVAPDRVIWSQCSGLGLELPRHSRPVNQDPILHHKSTRTTPGPLEYPLATPILDQDLFDWQQSLISRGASLPELLSEYRLFRQNLEARTPTTPSSQWSSSPYPQTPWESDASFPASQQPVFDISSPLLNSPSIAFDSGSSTLQNVLQQMQHRQSKPENSDCSPLYESIPGHGANKDRLRVEATDRMMADIRPPIHASPRLEYKQPAGSEPTCRRSLGRSQITRSIPLARLIQRRLSAVAEEEPGVEDSTSRRGIHASPKVKTSGSKGLTEDPAPAITPAETMPVLKTPRHRKRQEGTRDESTASAKAKEVKVATGPQGKARQSKKPATPRK